jgi:hypothetical protein
MSGSRKSVTRRQNAGRAPSALAEPWRESEARGNTVVAPSHSRVQPLINSLVRILARGGDSAKLTPGSSHPSSDAALVLRRSSRRERPTADSSGVDVSRHGVPRHVDLRESGPLVGPGHRTLVPVVRRGVSEVADVGSDRLSTRADAGFEASSGSTEAD